MEIRDEANMDYIRKIPNYRVGQRVQVQSFEEMQKNYITRTYSSGEETIYIPGSFIQDMRPLCGKQAVVKAEINRKTVGWNGELVDVQTLDLVFYNADDQDNAEHYRWTNWMVELVEDKEGVEKMKALFDQEHSFEKFKEELI